MIRPRMTGAASALLRLLLQRAGEEAHRIYLSCWSSEDWQSLTFTGERHEAEFVISGPGAISLAATWADGLEDADFTMPRGFVADIKRRGRFRARDDGSVELTIEALTVED